MRSGTGSTYEHSGGDPAPILACHPRVRKYEIKHSSPGGLGRTNVLSLVKVSGRRLRVSSWRRRPRIGRASERVERRADRVALGLHALRTSGRGSAEVFCVVVLAERRLVAAVALAELHHRRGMRLVVAGAFVPGVGVGGSRVAFVFVVSRFATRFASSRSFVAGLCPMPTENRHHDVRRALVACSVTDPLASAGTALLHHRRERATLGSRRRHAGGAPCPATTPARRHGSPRDKAHPPFIDAVLPAPHAALRRPGRTRTRRADARGRPGRRPDHTHRRQPANVRPRVLVGRAQTLHGPARPTNGRPPGPPSGPAARRRAGTAAGLRRASRRSP